MPTLPRLLFGNFSSWLWTLISLLLFLWELPFCLFYESMKTIICGLWNIHIGPGHLRNSVTSSLLIAHSLPPFLTTDVTTPRTICTYNLNRSSFLSVNSLMSNKLYKAQFDSLWFAKYSDDISIYSRLRFVALPADSSLRIESSKLAVTSSVVSVHDCSSHEKASRAVFSTSL